MKSFKSNLFIITNDQNIKSYARGMTMWHSKNKRSNQQKK